MLGSTRDSHNATDPDAVRWGRAFFESATTKNGWHLHDVVRDILLVRPDLQARFVPPHADLERFLSHEVIERFRELDWDGWVRDFALAIGIQIEEWHRPDGGLVAVAAFPGILELLHIPLFRDPNARYSEVFADEGGNEDGEPSPEATWLRGTLADLSAADRDDLKGMLEPEQHLMERLTALCQRTGVRMRVELSF